MGESGMLASPPFYLATETACRDSANSAMRIRCAKQSVCYAQGKPEIEHEAHECWVASEIMCPKGMFEDGTDVLRGDTIELGGELLRSFGLLTLFKDVVGLERAQLNAFRVLALSDVGGCS